MAQVYDYVISFRGALARLRSRFLINILVRKSNNLQLLFVVFGTDDGTFLFMRLPAQYI